MNTDETRTLIKFDMYNNRVDDTLGTINAMNNNFELLYDEIKRLKSENEKLKTTIDNLRNNQLHHNNY